MAFTVTVPPPHIPIPYTYAYSGCIHNLFHAVSGRVGLAVPTSTDTYRQYINYHARLWGHIIRRTSEVNLWTYDQVIESYTGKKRLRYANAKQEILEGRYVSSKLKVFVKVETSLYKEKKNFPTPRPIQFREFPYALEFATLIKPIEHVTYPMCGLPSTGSLPCIAKNLNSRERADLLRRKFDSFKDPHCYMLDAHRYDAHVNTAHIRAKWTFYDLCPF